MMIFESKTSKVKKKIFEKNVKIKSKYNVQFDNINEL